MLTDGYTDRPKTRSLYRAMPEAGTTKKMQAAKAPPQVSTLD